MSSEVWLHITSGGFTSVAAFGTEYSRRGQNEVMEKRWFILQGKQQLRETAVSGWLSCFN
ncbi:hypothetical protein HYN48_13855 [Flavobacterium magnum]|uniref:Uncharacterized protein n=1 Tax=Flavobacterium magnum TaxID=2162713 RepID=A0A2S0RH55_9FLAO|nr:hypothetical protein HYN48_13855 [Flavobacterium magnum]